VLRVLTLLILVPVATLLLWLGLGTRRERADFVVACDDMRTVDPHRVSWLDEIQVANALFEGLTRPNVETYQPEPGVAEHWEIDEAQQNYTFHLRRDARWSNGEPVTADHVRQSWLRLLDPEVEAPYATLLFVVTGAEDYYRSRLNDDPRDDRPPATVGVAAPDPRRLRVTLRSPCPYFLDLTSLPTLAPTHPPTIKRWAYRDGQVLRATRHRWTRPENIVCNGAFTLTRWDFKRRLLLKRNPHYWDAAGIQLDSIEIFITADPAVALLGYETGRVDLVGQLDSEVARVLYDQQRAGKRDDFHLGDRFATYFFRVNCRRPPFDNADLRKALSLAIDRPALCAAVLALGQTPADTYVPRGALRQMPRRTRSGATIYYQPPAGLGAGLSYAQRIELAREHLRKSGFDQLAPTRPIELSFAADPPRQRRVAEAVQSMWESALGVRVDLRVQERNVLRTRMRDLDYDIARSNWYGDFMDPATFLDMYTSTSGQNRTGWSHTRYDQLIAAAAREADNARRFALLGQAEQILCEQELPIIPLFFERGNYLLKPRIAGLHDSLRDILPIHRAHVRARPKRTPSGARP
jgi:oligopeptide transport system substrate-binding protein